MLTRIRIRILINNNIKINILQKRRQSHLATSKGNTYISFQAPVKSAVSLATQCLGTLLRLNNILILLTNLRSGMNVVFAKKSLEGASILASILARDTSKGAKK